MPGVDAHQHLWSDDLWAALARRRTAPSLHRAGDAWTLHLPAEPACRLDAPDDVPHRLGLLDFDEVDAAVVAPSLALGLEWLEPGEAHLLLAAHRDGVRAAGPRFERWASVPLGDPDPGFLRDELAEGALGLCLSSAAVGSAAALERVAPLLDVLEQAGAPLFIHPGPSADDCAASVASRWSAEPWWWPGLTDYVAGMQRAWLVWATHGRRDHPRLRVLFAMLAGLAPLQASRLAARGAPALAARATSDPLTFYDTSSYDAGVQQAVARIVGESQLVHGSDRPVVAGLPGGGPARAHTLTNSESLFGKAA